MRDFLEIRSGEILSSVIASLISGAILKAAEKLFDISFDVQSWIMVIAVVSISFYGLIKFVRQKRFINVTGKAYENKRVVLDGKQFVGCSFH